jgi:dolichol-phosphate mannosyltransferase
MCGVVCVVVPTYNERESIGSVLEKLLSLELGGLNLAVLVVDDGSPDGTAELVKEFSRRDSRVQLINRGRKMGLGSAYFDGFRHALGLGAGIIVSMDADGSHPPELVPKLVEGVLDGADVVVASRYVSGGRWAAGFRRMVVSRGANLLARVCTGLPLRDLTSGFRAYSKKAIELLTQKEFEKGYVFQVELLYRLSMGGFKLVETPFTFMERIAGRSKLSKAEILFFLKWSLKTLLRRVLRMGWNRPLAIPSTAPTSSQDILTAP